jgi:hypothetical protein
MNSLLDRGLFCMCWIFAMIIADKIVGKGTGETTYVALLIGASSIALVGLIIQAFTNTRKINKNG